MGNNNMPILAGIIPFKYCQTNSLILSSSSSSAPISTNNNQTDSKSSLMLPTGQLPLDSIHTFYYVDDQATSIKFNLSSLQAYCASIPIQIKLKMPDGVIIDSSFSAGSFSKDIFQRMLNGLQL